MNLLLNMHGWMRKKIRVCAPGPIRRRFFLNRVGLAMFSQLCTIKANVRHIQGTTSVKKAFGSLGWYYQLDYAFVLMFSDIEIKAQFAWIEDVSVY